MRAACRSWRHLRTPAVFRDICLWRARSAGPPRTRSGIRSPSSSVTAPRTLNGGRVCKPDSVQRASKHRPACRDDHSSGSRFAPGLMQPTRGSTSDPLAKTGFRAGPTLPSYLALLRAGFTVPRTLPPERWALTPPFHPCQTRPTGRERSQVWPGSTHSWGRAGGIFSVALSVVPKLRDPLALPGALSCGVRTFLSPSRKCGTASDRPTRPPIQVYRARFVWRSGFAQFGRGEKECHYARLKPSAT